MSSKGLKKTDILIIRYINSYSLILFRWHCKEDNLMIKAMRELIDYISLVVQIQRYTVTPRENPADNQRGLGGQGDQARRQPISGKLHLYTTGCQGVHTIEIWVFFTKSLVKIRKLWEIFNDNLNALCINFLSQWI